MSLVVCAKCGRQRSDAYMQEAVFRHPYWEVHDERVGIYRCSSSASCKAERKRLRKDGVDR